MSNKFYGDANRQQERLFTYGTLQRATVQIELFGRVLHGDYDQVKGFGIEELIIENEAGSEQQAYPAAVQTNNTSDIISGVVYLLTETELKIADSYETAAYQRVFIKLISGITAWIYLGR